MATYLFWDPLEDNIVREYDETGVVTAEYTTEPELYGNVISQRRQGQYRQFHYDGQGSTLAATDENQNVTDTFAYTAFGEVTERTGATDVPFQFIGQYGYYTDGLTGQIMARRRSYEPVTAKWLTVDPLGVRLEAVNPYVYASNCPTFWIDPSGEQDCPQCVPFVTTPPGPGRFVFLTLPLFPPVTGNVTMTARANDSGVVTTALAVARQRAVLPQYTLRARATTTMSIGCLEGCLAFVSQASINWFWQVSSTIDSVSNQGADQFANPAGLGGPLVNPLTASAFAGAFFAMGPLPEAITVRSTLTGTASGNTASVAFTGLSSATGTSVAALASAVPIRFTFICIPLNLGGGGPFQGGGPFG